MERIAILALYKITRLAANYRKYRYEEGRMVEKTQNETPVRHIETLPVSTLSDSSHHVSTLGERQEESGGSRRKLTRQVTSKLLQLKSSREEVQKRTFQKWVNMYLKPRGTHVTDLFTDLQDGVLLLQLLEQLSSEKLGRSRCVDEKLRALENVGMALTFLHSKGLKTVNIDATNITSGDSTLTLGMLWVIILKFQIHGMSNGDTNNNPATSDSPCRVLGSTLQQQLRGWLQETLGTTEQFNFSTSWNNGILLCRLLHAYRPDKVDMASVSKMSAVERVQHALNVAKSCFSVEPLLMPHDLATSIPDERVVLVYLSVLKSVLLGKHTARRRAAHFLELQERSRVMMGELEQAQEHCVEEMAGEWRKLRDTLHSDQPPQGLNEVFLVSSRQLASQYDKNNKAAQKKLHTYASELQELDKFEKEIKRLKHLASYVHSYRDSLAKVDIYKHGLFPSTPPHVKRSGPYVDSDYDIPSISCSATPLHYSHPMSSPTTKRKLTRGPSSNSLPSEDELGLLPPKSNNNPNNNGNSSPYDEDPNVSKYLSTSLHRGSMCGPPPKGFKDLLLDFDEEDDSCPWQIASVKRQVDDMDVGDVDSEDPVREIIRRKRIALHAKEGNTPYSPRSLDLVRLTNSTKEEFYTGSSKVIHQSEEGEITIRSDRKTKLYNRFKKFHLVKSLDELEEENMLDLLEDNMFVADDEDYVSVSSDSVSLFEGSDNEEEAVENFLPLMEHCVSVESLLSDIVELTSNSDLEISHQELDPVGSAPIVLSRDYDFEVHKTVVVTEVKHDDPLVKRLFEMPPETTYNNHLHSDPDKKLEGKTYSSQCTVWLRPDKHLSKSPAGDPKIYSADVTCVYGENTIVGEVTPGKDMSIYFSPDSPADPLSPPPLSPPRTPLKIDIVPIEKRYNTPDHDKTVHITYANNAAVLTPPQQNIKTKILQKQSSLLDERYESLDSLLDQYDSGLGPSLTSASDSKLGDGLANSTSPLDSGISSPQRNHREPVKTPDAPTAESLVTIPDRDRVLTISGSSSEGIERDLQVLSEPMSMLPVAMDLDSIPERDNTKDHFAGDHVMDPMIGHRLKRSKSVDSPGEVEHDGVESGDVVDNSDKNLESILSPTLLSGSSSSRRRRFTRRRSKGSELLSSDEEIMSSHIGGLSKYISMPRNDLVQAIIEESLSGNVKEFPQGDQISQSPEEDFLTPGVSDTDDVPRVLVSNVKQSESEYSLGELLYPSPPHSETEFSNAGDMVFGEYNLPHNDYITVYEAMLEIYDAAISGKKEMLHMLKKTAAVDDKFPIAQKSSSLSNEPGSPPEFEEIPKFSLSACYNVLTEDYKDRLDILDESLSSDSDGPSTSSSWFTFSSGKSSLRSSFEVHDDQRELKKMPSVDEEPLLQDIPSDIGCKEGPGAGGVNVYLVDGENAGDLVFGEIDIPFNDYVAEHLITLDRVSDSEFIAELMDASLRFWSEDVSTESDPEPPDVASFSLDETELAISPIYSSRPDSIPKITVDGIDDVFKQPKKRRRRKKKTKSRSPDLLPFPDTFIDLRLDSQAPPNTPVCPNTFAQSPPHISSQFLFNKALLGRDPLSTSENDEEKPSSPYPTTDTVDRLHILLDKPSHILESLSETEEEDELLLEEKPSNSFLRIHPHVNTQLPPHQDPTPAPLSPVREMSESPDFDTPDPESDVVENTHSDGNTDSDVPSKPPKPVLTRAQKRRLKKKKLCRTDSEVADKEEDPTSSPSSSPRRPPGLPRQRNTTPPERDSGPRAVLNNIVVDENSPSPSPDRNVVYLVDEDGVVTEGQTAEDLIFEEFDETVNEYISEMFVEHEGEEVDNSSGSPSTSSSDVMQGFCPTPDDGGETPEDLVFEEEEDEELFQGLISVYETVYETLVSNPVDTADVSVECDLNRPLTADIGTDSIVENNPCSEGQSQTDQTPVAAKSTQSFVDQRDTATSLPRAAQVDSASQCVSSQTLESSSQASPEHLSSEVQCGTPVAHLEDLAIQADLKPVSKTASVQSTCKSEDTASQSDLKPDSSSYETQCDIKPTSSCNETQCDTVSTMETSSQAEFLPDSSDVTQQADIRPDLVCNGQQADIRPDLVSNGQQADIRPDSVCNGQQADIRPESICNGQQADIRPDLVSNGQQADIRPDIVSNCQQADIRPDSVCCGQQADIRPESICNGQQADIRPESICNGQQADIRPESICNGQQADIRPESIFNGQQADIRPDLVNNSQQADIRPDLVSNSQQADIRPDSSCSASQCDTVSSGDQVTKANIRPLSYSSSTQLAPDTTTIASQFSPDCSDTASQAVSQVEDSSSQFDKSVNSVDTVTMETVDSVVALKNSVDSVKVVMSATQTEDNESEEELNIWTPDLICVDMEEDEEEEISVEADSKDRVHSQMEEMRPESVTQGTQWEDEEEFFDVQEPQETHETSSKQPTQVQDEIQRSDRASEGWNQRVEAVLSSPVLVSPTSWLDDQELIIQDLVEESRNMSGTPPGKLQTLSARQEQLVSLRHQITQYMDLCTEVEVKLGDVSSTLDKPNLWLSSSLDGGLQEQLDITKDLQSELRTIGEDITSVEQFAGKLDQIMPGQTHTSQNLRDNFNNLSARVGEKSNYLEVESNKFLKFRQDYNELGAWLQTALNDGPSEENDTAESIGSLQRSQNIYNTYKTRVDELSVLKLKLDNVIAYGRDLLIHLSPSAAKQLTSDLTILHTLWEKLDEEVRSRYSEVNTALEGLLNLQDHTNTITTWIEGLSRRESTHEPEGGDEYIRHVELYQGYLNQLNTQSAEIQSTRQLSHQLMGSLDSSYEQFISSQFETCNGRWVQLSDKITQKSERCHHLQDLQASLHGHEVMTSQFDSMLRELELLLRSEGYDKSFITGLPGLHNQITASLQLVGSLEKECGQLQLEDSVCSCGLEISLGTTSSKCRTKCQLLLELLSKYQGDLETHLSDVKLCTDLYSELTTELSVIAEQVLSALTNTSLPIPDRLEAVKMRCVQLEGLQAKRATANELSLKLFKLTSKSETDTVSLGKADLERTWLKVTDDSTHAQDELEAKASRLKEFQEKTEELNRWLSGLKIRVGDLDPNHIVVPSALQGDILSIKALGEELRKGEKVLEEVKFIGTALKEEDTSVDYGAELGLLLDTFSIIADSVSTKTGQYEAAVEDWDAFRQGAEESKACVSELKELLQQDDPIGPDLEDNFEEISKQRKYLYDACQGSVLALTNLSKKLVDKAGPDATAILLSELNSVQDEWEDAAEGAAQQEERHNTALSDWEDFKNKLEQLTLWLEDVQEELASDIPKITGGKQLQKLNSKQDDLENGIRTRDALYEELCEKGTFYINNCDFAELEERMDNLDTRWKIVEEEIPNRSENINALLSVWQDIDEGTRELKQWLNDAKVAIPAGDELSVHSGSVDDTAADLIRYKNFAEELRERRCNLHDLKAKLQDIEYEEDSGELKQLLGVFEELDKNLEGVKDNTLSWRQNLEDSANLWNVVSPADDSMIAQELNKLRNQQCNLAEAVTCLNTKIGEVLNQPAPPPSWCSTLLRWALLLFLAYLFFYTFILWLSDNGQCPGKSWRWWRQLTPGIQFRTYHPQPH